VESLGHWARSSLSSKRTIELSEATVRGEVNDVDGLIKVALTSGYGARGLSEVGFRERCTN